jgi:hypothetical protein
MVKMGNKFHGTILHEKPTVSQSIRNFPSFSEILTQQIFILVVAKLQFKRYYLPVFNTF